MSTRVNGMRQDQSTSKTGLKLEGTGAERDPAEEFFRYAEQESLLTAFDRPGLGKPTEPTRARIALDILIELYRRNEVVTDRTELKEAVSNRKAVEETGSQDIFDRLFSFSILVPVRRVTGGRDDKLLLHGDVIEWFSGVIDGAAVTTDGTRERAVMRFVNAQYDQDNGRSARAVAQDAWLYSRMIDGVETTATDAELVNEGKLKPDEPPAPDFLLADAFVPESQWGGKYNQHVLEGRLAGEVTPRSERLYERSLEQQMSSLLTAALYGAGGFWELQDEPDADTDADTDDNDADAEDEPDSEAELDDPLEGLSLDDFRAYLMGLDGETDPADIPSQFPEQVVKFETAYEPDRTRTAAYYAIKNQRMER